jgi:folate-binding Fe-S cluster repair protein YgfZ
MKRRGVVKSRMLPLRFEGPAPAAGAEVLNGELRAGVAASGVEGLALGLMRLDRIDGLLTVEGRNLTVDKPHWL